MMDDLTLELPISLGHYHPARCLPNEPERALAHSMGYRRKSNEQQRGQRF
jgi:hypothetical protein